MTLLLECTYCGKTWQRTFYSQEEAKNESCSKCGDKQLKAKEANKAKVDYYEGCPPFPPKDQSVNLQDFFGYGIDWSRD